MECTQILVESDEETSVTQEDNRRQVASLKTNGDSYPIFVGENRIGRDPKTCSIVFDNMALSGQHAIIEGREGGPFLIYDLNSRNKTRIGKMPLTPQVRYQLKNGEILRFANLLCTFCTSEGIKLRHVSLDDDESDTSVTAVDIPKTEPPETVDIGSDLNTSVEDEIFEKNTEVQSSVLPEESIKVSSETEDPTFKMPGPSSNKAMNSSMASLNKSDASCIEDYDDDIFDLPTQPYFRQTETGNQDDKEDTNQKDKGGGAIVLEAISSPEDSTEVEKHSDQQNAHDSEIGKNILDSIFSIKTEKKMEESESLEGKKKKIDLKKYSWDEKVDKFEDDEDTDDDGIFSAATALFIREDNKKKCSDESDKTLESSYFKQETEEGNVSKLDRSADETDPEDVFSSLTQEVNQRDNKEELEENKLDEKRNVNEKPENDKTTSTAVAGTSTLKTDFKKDECENNNNKSKDTAEDDIFSANTAPLVTKEKISSKQEEEDRYNVSFEDGEDSDDDIFAAATEIQFPMINTDKEKGNERDTKADSSISCVKDNIVPKENVSSACGKQKHFKNESKSIVEDNSKGTSSDYTGDLLAKSNGEKIDPDEKLEFMEIESKEVKSIEETGRSENKANELLDVVMTEDKLKMISEGANVENVKEVDVFNIISCSHENSDQERKFLMKKEVMLESNKNENDKKKSEIENQHLHSPQKVHSDEDNDTDIEDVCPPSIKKPSHITMKLENSCRGQNKSNSIDKPTFLLKSDDTTLRESSLSDATVTSDNDLVFRELSRNTPNRSYTSTGVLANATMEEDNEMEDAEEDQSGCLVIMSDTDDEKEVEDSMSELVNVNESYDKQQSSKNIHFHRDDKLIANIRSDAKGNTSPKIEDKDSENSNDKKLKKVSGNEVTKDKEKNSSSDVPDQQDKVSKIGTFGNDSSLKEVLTIKSDSEDENEDNVPGEHYLEQDKNEVINLEKKEMIDKDKTEKTLSNEKLDSDNNKIYLKESMTVNFTDKPINKVEDESINVSVPSSDKHNAAVVDMTLDVTLPDTHICVLTEKRATSSLKDETVNVSQMKDILSKAAKNDDKKGSHSQSKSLSSAKDKDADDFILVENKIAPQLKESHVNEDSDLDLSQEQKGAVKKVDEDNLNALKMQSSLDSSTKSSEEISDEKYILESSINSEPDSKATNESVSATNNNAKLGSKQIKIAVDIKSSVKSISENKCDGSSSNLKTSDSVVERVSLDKDLGLTESKTSQSSEISKLSSDRVEEENDISSSITEAPTDFQTPKEAYLKRDQEDEEDISSFLTQAPPEFKTPEVAVEKLKDRGEELDLLKNQSTPVTNSTKTIPEEVEVEEEDMSSFVTEAAPDFNTPKSIIEIESSDGENLSFLGNQSTPVATVHKAAQEKKEKDDGPSKISFEMITSDEEDFSMMDTEPAPGHKGNDNLSTLQMQSPPDINSPKADMGKVNDNDGKISLESHQVPSSKTILMKNVVKKEERKSVLTKPPPNKSPKLVNKIEKEDIEDFSLLDTQPAPVTEAQEGRDFKTPTLASRVAEEDEDDRSMLETQPAPGSVTIQVKNDAKGRDTVQVTADCATPKNVIKTEEEEEDDDLTILQTQPAPTYETAKRNEAVEDNGRLQAPADLKVPKSVVEKEENTDENLSFFEAQKSPQTEAAHKNKSLLSKEIMTATTKCKTSKSAVEVEGIHEEDLSLLETQLAPQSDITNANEEDEDMTQAPAELMDPNSVVEKEVKSKEDLRLLETQQAPQSETASDNEDEDMTQAPAEFKAPKSAVGKKENDKEDLSLLESQLASKSETSNANEDDDEDLSLLATQPAPQSDTTNVNEDENITQSPADFKAHKSVVEEVNDRASGNEEDEDMTQAPAEYNLEQAIDVKVNSNSKVDSSCFDTQPAPSSIHSCKASGKEKDSNENAKSSLPKGHENLKTSIIENISSDEEDLSNCETQQAPTFKTPKSVQQKDNDDIDIISSSSAKSQPEFKVATAAVENVTDDEEDLSSCETQPAPAILTKKVIQQKNKIDTENISSSSAKSQEGYKLPSVAIEDVTDDEDDLSNCETQPAPTFVTKKVLEQKNKNVTQNISSTSVKAQQEYKLPSVAIEDVTDDEEDLSNFETQPAPTFVTKKVLPQKNKNVMENVSSSSAKTQSESKLPSIAIEDVTDDEDDLSSFDTQPAPVFQSPVSVNGKAKKVTPSRKSLRKSIILKNEKESAKKASAVDKGKDNTGEESLEKDDDSDVDIGIALPDTPDLINTLNEYNNSKPRSSSNSCRNLFNLKKSGINSENIEKLPDEVKASDISLKSTENILGKDQKQRSTRSKTAVADKDDVSDKKNANVGQKIVCGDKNSDNIRGKPKTLLSEMERRPPSTRSVDKQQALMKMESISGSQLASNKKQRLEKSVSELNPGNNRKFGKAFDKSPQKDEPATKRKPKLEIKLIKQEKVAVVEVKESPENNSPLKPNLRGRKKIDSITEKVTCDSSSNEGKVSLKMSSPPKNVHLKKIEEVKVQEIIPKRGRRSKKEQSNELKIGEIKEELCVKEAIDTNKEKISATILGKGKRAGAKELKAVKESVSPEKKTRSSRSVDVSDLDNSATKTEEKVKIDGGKKRHSSPARKKSLRAQTKLNHPEVKELEIHKDAVSDSSLHSMEEDKKEIIPIQFYGKRERSSLKERKLESDTDTTSPNSPPRKKRQQEVIVKVSVKEAGNSSSNIPPPSSKSPESVRRSSRMRKPKRRFTLDKSPEDAMRKKMPDEIEIPKAVTSLQGQKRGRKRKADSKKVSCNSSTSSQEDILSSPESISCISSNRKLEEKESVRSSKRCKLAQDGGLKVEDSTFCKEDKRGRKIPGTMVNSAPPSTSTPKEGSRGQKGIPREVVPGIVREVAKRGRRKSSTSNEQPTPLSSESKAEEVNASQVVQTKADDVGNTKTAGRRGRKKSTSPTKWSGQFLSSTSTLSSSADEINNPQEMDGNEQNVTKRVGRRGRKKSSTPADVVTALAVTVEDISNETGTNWSEVPKALEESSIKGVPKRGRKKSNTPVKLTSPDRKKVDNTGTSLEEIQQKEILDSSEVRRRGRKRSCNASEVSAVIIKEKTAAAINISESKTALGSRRTGSMSSRSSSSFSKSISETPGQEKSLRVRNQKKNNFNVLFTGVSDPKLEQTVERLGGSVVETPQECNILVTDRLRRTYKLLCAVARGIPIVTVQWLIQSSSSSRFLDPLDFLINDKLTEKRFDFTLKTSLERAKLKPLLTGYSILATPSVLPPPEEVKGIITCAGGEYIPSLKVLQKKIPEQLYVVSCADDSAIWNEYKELGIKKKPMRGRSHRSKGTVLEESSKALQSVISNAWSQKGGCVYLYTKIQAELHTKMVMQLD